MFFMQNSFSNHIFTFNYNKKDLYVITINYIYKL